MTTETGVQNAIRLRIFAFSFVAEPECPKGSSDRLLKGSTVLVCNIETAQNLGRSWRGVACHQSQNSISVCQEASNQ